MIDLHEQALAYLQGQGFKGLTLKRLDQMTGKEGIVVRPLPGALQEAYYDGTSIVLQPYQIIVRSRSEERAMEQCSAARDALEGVTLCSANGSYQPYGTDGQQVQIAPQELALEESNFYAWHVRMGALIEC